MAYGVTPTGFVIKPLTQILEDVRQRQRDAPEIGPQIDQSDTSSLGQLNGTIGSEVAELWELAAAVDAANDPEGAEDVPLDKLCSITGTVRRAPAPTRATLTCVLNAGVTVPAGSVVAVDGQPDITFELATSVTNPSGVQDAFDVLALCTEDGPVVVNAGTLTDIVTPVAGWVSVTNAEDADPGHFEGTNTETRELRSAQLARRGGSTVKAIRADVLEIEAVEDCVVLENTGAFPDANGLPGKSFEVLIDDGDPAGADDDEVAQAIIDSKPAGIEAFGSTDSGTATDADTGATYTIPFTRVERLEVYVDLAITAGPGFPVDGLAQVETAIGAVELVAGADIIALFIRSKAFSVAGVVDVPTFTIGLTPSPGGTGNIPVTPRQRATFSAVRVNAVLA